MHCVYSFLKPKLEVPLLVEMGMLAVHNGKWINPQINVGFSVNGKIGSEFFGDTLLM